MISVGVLYVFVCMFVCMCVQRSMYIKIYIV